MYDVHLEVNGTRYGGFRSGEFTLSLEQMCNDFSLNYSDVWADDSRHAPIQEGDRCKLIVDDNTMIDGWVDVADGDYDATSWGLQVQGRSTACDLVDCSAMNEPGQWTNKTVPQIVADLVNPFAAVQLITLGEPGSNLGKFTLQRGETAGSAILRAARLRSFLVYTAGDTLVLAKVSATRTSTVLRRGQRILKAKKHASLQERYSDYYFKGQTRATDQVNGVAASQIRGDIEDHGVPRYRPLKVVAGGAEGPADLGARAIMERNQRAGRSERLSMKVEGWKTDEGYLWEPNILVRVTDDWHDIDQDMIVVSASFTFNGDTGSGGYTTMLEVCDPKAFDTGDVPLIRRRRRPTRVEIWAEAPAGQTVSPLVDIPGPLQSGIYTYREETRAAPQPSASHGRRHRRAHR